jgi:hypothetical protein
MKYLKISLIFNLLALVHTAHILNRVMLNNPDALCLDGSPGAYFIHEGDRQKILLYF